MFADNRANGVAGFVDSDAQISNRNNKKVKQIFNLCLEWILGLWGSQNNKVHSLENIFTPQYAKINKQTKNPQKTRLT